MADADRLPSIHLAVWPIDLGDEPGFLVVFPTPERAAEAAIAMIPDREFATRYFVLERGWDIVATKRCWVLCEWSAGSHLNLGQCGEYESTDPSNVVDAMRNAVVASLSRMP
jgi:hypothetical protein